MKKGFKQTEIGLVPEDWEVLSIQKFIDRSIIIDHVDGNHGALYPKTEEFVDFGVPYVGANALTNNRIDFSKCKYLKRERANKFIKGIAKPGDILFAHNATVGPVGQVDDIYNKLILSTTLTYFRTNNDLLNSRYLLYSLSCNYFIKQYSAVMSQSTRNQVPITVQKKFYLSFPSLYEQKAIASALTDADTWIQSLEKLLQKKRLIKQGAMHELLKPKENWEEKDLGSIIIKKPDYGINAASIPFNEVYPTYLRITDIDDHGKIIKAGLASVKHRKSDSYFLNVNDIVVARTGASVGKTYIHNKKNGNLIFAGFLIRIIADPVNLNPIYLFYYTKTKYYNNWIESNSMRTGQPGINSVQLQSINIKLPSLPEQTRIATILSDMDAEIDSLEQKLIKARQIKQGMMQQLLTGSIRLINTKPFQPSSLQPETA